MQTEGGAAGAVEAKRLEAAHQAEIQKRFDEKKAELEAKAALSKERTELLDLKLKSLQQQFYSFGNMQTKDLIQKQIVETYQTLQAAAAEQARARDELDKFLELGAKDKAAAAGIK
jgi:thioesterase domain-containing protein